MPLNDHIMDNPKSDRVRQIADLANRRAQKKTGKFLIEGPQSVREAVAADPCFVADVYIDPEAGVDPTIADGALSRGIYVHQATGDVMARMSADCQGVAAVGTVNGYESLFETEKALSPAAGKSAPEPSTPLIAACWQVRDPGNEGTMIRTADAAGCAAIILVGTCVNPLNPKVIRSTAGSLFHIPVLRMSEDEFFEWASGCSANLWAADIHGTASNPPIDLASAAFGASASQDAFARDAAIDRQLITAGKPTVVLFGNEARGLPAQMVERAGKSLMIPIYGAAESLNLASSGAVILYTLAMYLRAHSVARGPESGRVRSTEA